MGSKRQDIVETADRVFYRDGFAAVGIDRLVEEAEVALGTLYRHFRTRSEVVVAALAHRHEAFVAKLGRAAPSGGGADAVLGLFDALGAWGVERGGNGCFFLRAAADYPHDAEIRAAALAHKRAYLALIEQRLRQGGWSGRKVPDLAASLFVLLEGAVAAAFTLGDAAAIGAARKAAEAILAGAPPSS